MQHIYISAYVYPCIFRFFDTCLGGCLIAAISVNELFQPVYRQISLASMHCLHLGPLPQERRRSWHRVQQVDGIVATLPLPAVYIYNSSSFTFSHCLHWGPLLQDSPRTEHSIGSFRNGRTSMPTGHKPISGTGRGRLCRSRASLRRMRELRHQQREDSRGLQHLVRNCSSRCTHSTFASRHRCIGLLSWHLTQRHDGTEMLGRTQCMMLHREM